MQADKRIRDEIDRSIGERPHGVPAEELLKSHTSRALASLQVVLTADATPWP